MHTYQRRWADDLTERTLPRLGDFTFTNPLDVVAYAELDAVLAWSTYPATWHLDEAGLTLRRALARHGITLLDVMVFDQEFHWWSLHAVTSGIRGWR